MARRQTGLRDERLTGSIIGAFFDVYNTLGFGFLEHVYCLALDRELAVRGHRVRREVSVPIHYKGKVLTSQRIDRVVDEKVVVEVKSAAQLPAFAERQLMNYLRATKLEVVLLLHFGPEAKFHRVVSLNDPTAVVTPATPAPESV